MGTHQHLTDVINRELRFLQGALELVSDLAGDNDVAIEDVFEALDQALRGFKDRVADASWAVDPTSSDSEGCPARF